MPDSSHSELGLSRPITRSFALTALFLQQQLWIWPLVAAGLLVVVGVWVRGKVDQAIHVKLGAELETLLKADVAGLEIWLESQKFNAAAAARSPDLVRQVGTLIELAGRPEFTPLDLVRAPATKELVAELTPWLEEHEYSGYFVADDEQRILAAHAGELLGKQSLPGYSEFLPTVLAGEATVSHPFPSVIMLSTVTGGEMAGVPTMYAAAPIRNATGRVIAALGLRLRPDVDFTRIMSVARGGQTGETYAFNRQGLLLSESRFDDDLKRFGLIADRLDSRSVLQLEMRDPGGNLYSGFRSAPGTRQERPLTESVATAVAGNSGVNTVGYRDYRGVPVVAAWTWLPAYEFGVVTEIDRDEAYAPLYIVHPVFWGLFGLLTASALAIFVFTVFVSRLKQAAAHEALQALKLGQYQLEEKIGQGGMGTVYRGHHAMLRRPTAIKLLDIDKTTPTSIARFEREVRLTAQLNHPNTIAIYDFGRTPEGIFYYAMELLEGINLGTLVRSSGPQPEGRVIHLLMQVCGSLSEAHGRGLIHRDVKPGNIMVCQRGGMYDVVKLLDFGLVKAVDAQGDTGLTSASAIMGTPLYLSPEAVTDAESVDARSDVYSLGAVGYFLLTGTTVFSGSSVTEICRKQVDELPELPSRRLGREIDFDLEAVIMRCLGKSPCERPQTAEELGDALWQCVGAGTWTPAAARAWWSNRVADTPAELATPSTTISGNDMTVIGPTSSD